ncbi:unnamed protein product, partial [Ectocarpus sp. 12 AP-2014]
TLLRGTSKRLVDSRSLLLFSNPGVSSWLGSQARQRKRHHAKITDCFEASERQSGHGHGPNTADRRYVVPCPPARGRRGVGHEARILSTPTECTAVGEQGTDGKCFVSDACPTRLPNGYFLRPSHHGGHVRLWCIAFCMPVCNLPLLCVP